MVSSSRFRSNQNYYVSASCNEALLAPISSNTAEMGASLALNETSLLIVRAMEDGLSIEQIVDKLMAEYVVESRSEVEGHVVRIASALVAKGFFSVQD